MIERVIHNPAQPQHFKQIRPLDREVSFWVVEKIAAKTSDALRILEIGAPLC